MVSKRSKNVFVVLLAVIMHIMPNTIYANKTIFDSIKKTTKLQKDIIMSCEKSDLSYNVYDNLQMPFVSIRAFIASIKAQNGVIPEIIVFNAPFLSTNAIISGLYPEENVYAGLNTPYSDIFVFEPKYKCIDVDEFLSQGKLLLLYDCNFHGLELGVELLALSKDTTGDRIHSIIVKYIFQLAFVDDRCDKDDFKESLHDFIEDVRDDENELVLENGVLLDSYQDEIGWLLKSIDFSEPAILDHPEVGVPIN